MADLSYAVVIMGDIMGGVLLRGNSIRMGKVDGYTMCKQLGRCCQVEWWICM
jgi:hypothetical protein